MKRYVRFDVVLVAAVLAALAATPLVQAGPSEQEVPTAIAVKAGQKPFLVGHAVGVQIYRCGPVAGGYKWNPVGPRADVYGDNGRLIMTHFAGPSWQAKDGSKVVAAVEDRATVDPTAIPWLRLVVTSATGTDGDRLVDTTYIQRIATAGGLAPAAADCNAGTAGDLEEVDYTADYVFWKAASN